MTVLDVRGTNGAGKSWVVHTLMKDYKYKTSALGGKGKVTGYEILKFRLGIVGTYNSQCGGCDTIKSANQIEERVRLFHSHYCSVLFEGITVAHTYGRYNSLALDLGADNYYFLFLDTPLKTCIARVKARRKAKGNTKPFDPYKYMGLASDYDRVLSAYRKLKAAGRNVIDLDYTDPMKQVLELLRS